MTQSDLDKDLRFYSFKAEQKAKAQMEKLKKEVEEAKRKYPNNCPPKK